MPLADASYDAAISSYAIDHMGREGTPKAIKEVARVLNLNGEFLLQIVNPDIWVTVLMPIPHVGINAHFKPNPVRWRAMLHEAGFQILDEGTAPATMYWLARQAPGWSLIPARTRATATRWPTTAAAQTASTPAQRRVPRSPCASIEPLLARPAPSARCRLARFPATRC